MAQQQLFDAVTDALEEGGDEWLDAATSTFPSVPEHARYCLRDVLMNVLQDYELSDGEQRRLRRLTRDVPERAELPDLGLSPEQLAAAIVEVLDGVIQYLDAYQEIVELTYGED
jgi:hypothetical protein